MADTQVVQDLTAARDLLRKVGFIQGTFAVYENDKPVKYCSVGAINEVTLGDAGLERPVSSSGFQRRGKALNALRKALPGHYRNVVRWNDSHKREEVIETFNRAIELAKKES